MIDCHMHSIHSPDSHATMDEMCEAAIDAGLRGICFTEHVDLDPHYYSYGSYDYAETMKDTARCREKYGDRLLIMAGVEITYITEYADDVRRFLGEHNFDYVLGSIHLIDHVFVGSEEHFIGKTEQEAYEPYWQEMIAMMESGLIKRVGHMDYIKNHRPKEYGPFRLERWENYITEILHLIVENDATLEVNTSAIRRGFSEPYPSWEILELYRAVGGKRVTIGSDAHRPGDVGAHFADVSRRLDEMGLIVCGEEIFCCRV